MIDYFLGSHAFASERLLQRARTLIGILLTLFIGLLAYSIFIYISVYHQAAEVAVDSWIFVVPLAVLMAILLLAIRVTGRCLLISNILVFLLVTILLTTVYVTGGPSKTPALPLMVVPVVIAFCIAGRRSGVAWGMTMLALVWSAVVADYAGYSFPSITDQAFIDRIVIMNWSVAYISVVAIVIVYESINLNVHREQEARSELLRHLATHDSLTGVANRMHFEDLLRAACERYQEGDGFIAVLFIDLDNFKPINDAYGHAAGDTALAIIARRLSKAMRVTDHVARIGGDEFAILADHIRSDEVLDSIIDKIVNVIEKPLDDIGEDLRLTASIGVAFYPQHARTPEDLLRCADKAMYRAKQKETRHELFSG